MTDDDFTIVFCIEIFCLVLSQCNIIVLLRLSFPYNLYTCFRKKMSPFDCKVIVKCFFAYKCLHLRYNCCQENMMSKLRKTYYRLCNDVFRACTNHSVKFYKI